ncbi:hypothetical protein [Novosphingobium sp. CECT 9465]|uniref:hypothetical protein n=1 Tax=Novosphingobium sp. CECT 9465 TaxID=2829794 RepID=UPI001E4FF0C9|nr:hypothetical protein [Novosphingobium sp. CECT 9465]CAH0498478.1 hypothetical protein NVSP9465_03566 [Novosphingobium sp. CECT 9465]
MNLGKAVGLFLLFDHMQRSNNYHEMVDRLNGHISRWEDSISRLESTQSRISDSIHSNKERLAKAEGFLERQLSPPSQEWAQRQEKIATTHSREERRAEAAAKLLDYRNRVASAEQRIVKLRSWIAEGESRCSDISRKISDIEYKIRNARSKI